MRGLESHVKRSVTGQSSGTPMHPRKSPQALAAAPSIGRMGEVSDIVEAVIYLDGGRGFVTGEVITSTAGRLPGTNGAGRLARALCPVANSMRVAPAAACSEAD